MTPPDQSLPLEKLFYGMFFMLVLLVLGVSVMAVIRLKALSRGPGRSPHRASMDDLGPPAAPAVQPPTPSRGPARDSS